MKKRYFLLAFASLLCLTMSAADLTGKRIYVNPGHGSFGPNDRPMATIPFPNLKTTGMPDTCGFYETNTNLWKCLYLGKRLEQAGAYVMYSRKQNGPWPYTMVNGDYPDYWWDSSQEEGHPLPTSYNGNPDYEKYNRSLSEICEEVEANNFDLFISVHSNAATDGTVSNYPLWLYRGTDAAPTDFEKESKAVGAAIWPYRFAMMAAGYDQASSYTTSQNLRGDIDFYDKSSTRHSAVSGKDYTGYLGVLKHGAVGGLYEGYFHTYQPARHRALNHDHCHMEGYSYYQGIIDYFGADKDTKGYILGTVKDLHEKIVHKLFNYSPKTNDQWLPCNGAVVTLYKGGTKVAEYNVDTLYNGVFYFGDLEPGDDYTLDATCEGYKPLFDEYKTPVSVKANTVTYPMIYLESETYEPPKVEWKDYMDPEQPAWLGLAGSYAFSSPVNNTAEQLTGKTIHRSLLRDDTTMYVLAFDAEQNPYIYLINPGTMEVKQQLSTVGMQGSIRTVGDIALTADGVLLACNYSENQYNDDYVSGGNTNVRGTFRVYRWEDLAAAPVEVFTSQYSCNWYRANIGNSMSVSGAYDDMTVVVTGPTISESGVLRLAVFSVTDGALVSTMRCQDPNGDPALTLPNYGWDMQLKPSPLNEGAFMLIGDKTGVTEISFNGDGAVPNYLGKTEFIANGATFFRYAKHSLMAVPLPYDGVSLYDITNGLQNAVLVKTGTYPVPTSASDAPKRKLTAEVGYYNLAAGTVAGENMTLYWLVNDEMLVFTTKGVDQPVVKGIYAYDLTVEQPAEGKHLFKFKANADATYAQIFFYDNEGNYATSIFINNNVKEGDNEFEIDDELLPGNYGDSFTWAIELTGDNVGRWGKIHDQKVSELGITRGFCSIDKNPQSDYFGRIYMLDRAGANDAKSGLHVFSQDYTKLNSSVLKGGRNIYGSPYRSWVDDQGYIWLSDGSDGYSGVVVANPADLEGTYEEFFDFDNRDSEGVLTKGGVELASSVLGLSIYGTGADTKLLLYNEDAGSTLGTFSLLTYNIGNADGTYKHKWSEAPSSKMNIAGQAAWDGQPYGCSHGVWIAQRRSAGQNNASATALKFYSWDGTELLSSHSEEYKDIINGCMSGAMVLTEDESQLIMIDGSSNLLVFDVTWEGDKPILSLRYEYPCGISDIREMHFDYAGNLVTSGTVSFTVFAVPHDGNITLTPAKKSLTVVKTEAPAEIPVEAVELDQTELSLKVGETATLTATIFPDDATNQDVVWSSSDEAVATVVDGVVTAVAEGEALITVTAVDGGSAAQCLVRVSRIDDGLEALAASGIYYRDGIIYNGQGLPLAVFDLQGRCVAQGNGDINLTMMPSAVYIIRTGSLSVKVVR